MRDASFREALELLRREWAAEAETRQKRLAEAWDLGYAAAMGDHHPRDLFTETPNPYKGSDDA